MGLAKPSQVPGSPFKKPLTTWKTVLEILKMELTFFQSCDEFDLEDLVEDGLKNEGDGS